MTEQQRGTPQGDELREGTWTAIQQGAQVFGEIGGGAAGITVAAKAAVQVLSGRGSGSETPAPPPDKTE